MKSPTLSLTLVMLFATAGLGCLWINGTTLTGHRVNVHDSHLPHKLREARDRTLRGLEGDFSPAGTTNPAQAAEREALNHILNCRFSSAVSLLEKAEALAPGSYSTAANLGTAYELAGRNADALRMIREGMRRNPGSHEGTEWVHEMILVRKVENDASGHISKAPLVLLPDSFDTSTQINVGGTSRKVESIKQAIKYQLLERMAFVKPKDPYVSDLLLTLALIQSRFHTLEMAMELLEMAIEYGHPDTARVDGLKLTFAEVISEANLWENVKLLFYILLGGLVLGGYITIRLKMRRRLQTT